MKSSRVSELVADSDAAVGDDEGDEDGGHDEVAADLSQRGHQEAEERLGILQEVEQSFDQLLHLAEGVQAELDGLEPKTIKVKQNQILDFHFDNGLERAKSKMIILAKSFCKHNRKKENGVQAELDSLEPKTKSKNDNLKNNP